MTRYKILDDLLGDRYHNYSLDDLTEEVGRRLSEIYPETNGVVRRTIEKDIKYLEYEGPFLAEIERYTVPGYSAERGKAYSKQCLRYADPYFSIFKKAMSAKEEYLLREALSILGRFDGLPNLGTLEGMRLGLGARRNERRVVSLTKNPLENSSLLGELFTTITRRQVIELRYRKFGSGEPGLALGLHPYLLKEYNRRWFLFGSAEADGKLLCFALDRIEKVTPLPSHRYLDYEGDINERFEDIIGVTTNEESPVYNIVFWVSDVSKDYIATKPLHESQRNIGGQTEAELREKYPALRSGRFFRIDCKDNYELIRELTSFGKELVVLSPSEIREKIVQRIEDCRKVYQSTN